MKLYKDENLDIRLDGGLNILKIKLLKEYLETLVAETIADTFLEVQARKILLDFGNVKQVDDEVKGIIEKEFGKTLKQTGARKIAIVLNNEILKGAFENLEDNYEVKKLKWNYFDNAEPAEKWLRER